jgi:hypothetical protein
VAINSLRSWRKGPGSEFWEDNGIQAKRPTIEEPLHNHNGYHYRNVLLHMGDKAMYREKFWEGDHYHLSYMCSLSYMCREREREHFYFALVVLKMVVWRTVCLG